MEHLKIKSFTHFKVCDYALLFYFRIVFKQFSHSLSHFLYLNFIYLAWDCHANAWISIKLQLTCSNMAYKHGLQLPTHTCIVTCLGLQITDSTYQVSVTHTPYTDSGHSFNAKYCCVVNSPDIPRPVSCTRLFVWDLVFVFLVLPCFNLFADRLTFCLTLTMIQYCLEFCIIKHYL